LIGITRAITWQFDGAVDAKLDMTKKNSLFLDIVTGSGLGVFWEFHDVAESKIKRQEYQCSDSARHFRRLGCVSAWLRLLIV
jgi:hypothetical protein